MTNKKETPAQIAERALRKFKDGTPIPVLLDAVEKALSESIVNEPKVWVPDMDEWYYTVNLSISARQIFVPCNPRWNNSTIDKRRLELGWVFRTMKEAQTLCDKLNEAIKDIVS